MLKGWPGNYMFNLIEHIESLRTQPRSVRNSYALGVALSFTGLIAIVWLISLPSRFEEAMTASSDDASDGPGLREELSGLGNMLSDNLSELRTQAEIIGALSSEATTSDDVAILQEQLDALRKVGSTTIGSTTATTTDEAAEEGTPSVPAF